MRVFQRFKYIHGMFSKGFCWGLTRDLFKHTSIVLTIVQKFQQLFVTLFNLFGKLFQEFHNFENISWKSLTYMPTIVGIIVTIFDKSCRLCRNWNICTQHVQPFETADFACYCGHKRLPKHRSSGKHEQYVLKLRILTRWCPSSLAKLVYKSNFTLIYGWYIHI